MAFVNLERVDTNFMSHYLDEDDEGSKDYIKCPVCGGSFLVGANDDLPHGWPSLIHTPKVFTKYDEYVEKNEFTCPFLMKPLLLPCECHVPRYSDIMAAYKDTWISSFKEILVDDSTDNTWIAPEKFLQESINQYSHMLKLNGTTCKYCRHKYEFSYGFNEDTGGFSCNFKCSCTAVRGAEDLSRLALKFGKEFDKKSHNKHEDYIKAVISRMPQGAKMPGRPLR